MENLEEKVKKVDYLEKYQTKVVARYPLLGDERFISKYPGIIEVAAFIEATREMAKINGYGEAIPFFKEKGIEDLGEYLNLINSWFWFDKGARAHYKALKEILERFKAG